MVSFVSYIRVSTSRQGASGLGLEAQRASVAQYVTNVGGELLAEYTEVESGKRNDRPVLRDALARCRKQGAVLVIAKLDRLARNVAFISALIEARTEFIAVDAPYANKLMLHLLAAFAEHEREQIGLRTKAALAAAKARGVKLGTYGVVLAATNRAEALDHAETLRPILAPLVGPDVTLQAIADTLIRQQVPTRDGGTWTPTTVRRVLIRLGLHQGRNGLTKPATEAPNGLIAPGLPIHHQISQRVSECSTR